MIQRSLGALLLLLAPALALASDGLLEINHTCATQTGCFDGDTANYPVTITAPGSYRLTSNLAVPDENTDGISVETSSVSVDLSGFEITRTACVGVTTNCTPASGTGSGVDVTLGSEGVAVRNGSITGMGARGVFLRAQSEAQNLRVRWNRQEGVRVGVGSTVSGITAYENDGDGILASSGSTVSGSSSYRNEGNGIWADAGSTVAGNTAYLNTGDGIFTNNGCTVAGNTTSSNSDDGIEANFGSTVFDNTSYDNGGDGVVAFSGSSVQRNTVRSNTGFGLTLSTTVPYRENTITGNTAGTVSQGVDVGANFCDTNTTCP